MESTVVVGVAGVLGTLLAGLGAPMLAARRSDASRLREERVLLYTDALKHYADLRQRFFTEWFTGLPPGGKVTPPPQDEVTARMTLLAPAAVRNAWLALVAAERSFDTWIALEHSGDPDEGAPRSVIEPLDAALESLLIACQSAVGNHDD